MHIIVIISDNIHNMCRDDNLNCMFNMCREDNLNCMFNIQYYHPLVFDILIGIRCRVFHITILNVQLMVLHATALIGETWTEHRFITAAKGTE